MQRKIVFYQVMIRFEFILSYQQILLNIGVMSFLTEPQIQNAHIQIILAWVWLKDIMEQCQKNSIMQLFKHTGIIMVRMYQVVMI